MEKFENTQLIGIWIIFAIVFFFVIVVAFVSFAYISFRKTIVAKVRESNLIVTHQKKLLEASISVQEEERNRIASDLHDALIGKLVRLRLKSDLVHANADIDFMIKESIEEARRISHDLAPPMLEFKNLAEIVNETIKHWILPLNVKYNQRIFEEPAWSVKTKTQFIRILQETLNNIYKHAHSSEVNITCRSSKKSVILLVTDNGKGFNVKEVKKGIGLYSLESRTQHLGGRFLIQSKPNIGSKFLYILPN